MVGLNRWFVIFLFFSLIIGYGTGDWLNVLFIAVWLNMSLKITALIIMQEIGLGTHP